MKREKANVISNISETIGTIFQKQWMSSSLDINLIFHCLRTYYITCTAGTISYSFADFTSPFNSKLISRDVCR